MKLRKLNISFFLSPFCNTWLRYPFPLKAELCMYYSSFQHVLSDSFLFCVTHSSLVGYGHILVRLDTSQWCTKILLKSKSYHNLLCKMLHLVNRMKHRTRVETNRNSWDEIIWRDLIYQTYTEQKKMCSYTLNTCRRGWHVHTYRAHCMFNLLIVFTDKWLQKY